MAPLAPTLPYVTNIVIIADPIPLSINITRSFIPPNLCSTMDPIQYNPMQFAIRCGIPACKNIQVNKRHHSGLIADTLSNLPYLVKYPH